MKKRISLNKSAFLSKILFWGVIGLLAFLTLFPLYYLLLTSLKSPLLILRQPPLFLFKPSFSNYYRLFIESGYGYYFVNSFIISLFSTVIALIIGTLGAFAFAKFKFWLDRTLFLLVLVTRSFLPVTTAIPLFLFAAKAGLLDTKLLLIIVFAAVQTPLVLLVMRNFIKEIPDSIFESAELEGCSSWDLFFRIAIPLVKPGLLAVALLSFIFSWNEFLFPLITTAHRAVTAPVAISAFREAEAGIQWGELSALGVITSIPVLIFIAFFKKLLVKGLQMGAIKG